MISICNDKKKPGKTEESPALLSGTLKIFCASFLFLFFLSIFDKTSFLHATENLSVGIIQTIEHPALDQTRQGILDELKENGILPSTCIWESAQGNPALATQIAAKFLGQKVNVIVAVGTLCAQVALRQAQPSQTPVVFASVTDPGAAKLKGNITGVSNFVDLDQQFNFIAKICPQARRIGVIYNPGEANSVSLMALTKKACEKRGWSLVIAPAMRTADVPTAAQSLVEKVDLMFINNDNTALSAFETIVKIAKSFQIPLFTSDIDLVDKGAVAALGPDQYQIGRQAGQMVVQILKDPTMITQLPVSFPLKINTRLNNTVAQTLNLNFPPEFLINNDKG